MVTHRCTRCKEDVGEYGIRHKYAQGLFCESCLSYLGIRHSRAKGRGFWGRLWDRLSDFVSAPFGPKRIKLEMKETARAAKVTYSVAKIKARDIPLDAVAGVPQKR